MAIGVHHDGSEEYRSAFHGTSIGIAALAVDGTFTQVNPALCRLTGYSESQLLAGAGFASLLAPDDLPLYEKDFGAAVAGEPAVAPADRMLLAADGSKIWVELSIHAGASMGGLPGHIVLHAVDVTERRAAHDQALRRSAQQGEVAALGQLALTALRADELAHQAVAGIHKVMNVETVSIAREDDRSGKLVVVAGQDRVADVLAEAPGPDLRHARYALDTGAPVHVIDRDHEQRFDVDGFLGRGVRSGVSLPMRCADGDPGVLTVYRRQAGGLADHELEFLAAMVSVLNGAATRLQSEDELLRQSMYDTVTDVPNRRFLLSSLSELLKSPGQGDRRLTVISLGLVNRRAIHESLGHDAGDSFLSEIGQRIAMLLTLDETLARSDGDEFVIVSPDLTNPEDATDRVRDLLGRVAGPVTLEGFELPPHLVAGVVVTKVDPQIRPEDLLRDASAAMYRAVAEDMKVAVFDEAMRAETVERLSLVAELRRAIDTRSLYLAYQPVVSRSAGRVTKYEALVRWSHPVRGEIGPGRFVPLAETHGLIGRLGSYVLGEALDQLRRWRDAGDTLGDRSMAVNISRAQLDDPGLVEEILEALDVRSLAPSSLMIEVTESALTGDSQAALETVKALSEAGVQIALDDFGVGQSSLASLTELPLDVLKLDRSLVHDVANSPQRVAIMSAVSQIAQTLDLVVVAEGIETEDEARITAQLGCDLGQGWFYARPTAPDELPGVVAALDASMVADALSDAAGRGLNGGRHAA